MGPAAACHGGEAAGRRARVTWTLLRCLDSWAAGAQAAYNKKNYDEATMVLAQLKVRMRLHRALGANATQLPLHGQA